MYKEKPHIKKECTKRQPICMRFVQNEKENTFYLIFGIDKEDDKAKHSAHSPARQLLSEK